MTDLTLSQRLRTGHLKRWHMVRVFREQTLAEHNSLVQIIALHAADMLIENSVRFAGDVTNFRMQIMEWSLWHDMPEVVTGDLSTPLKRMMIGACGPGSLDKIEKSVDSHYKHLVDTISNEVKMIVKFADLYEAVHFLHMEGHGPRAQNIELELIERLKDHVDAVFASDETLGEILQKMVEDMNYDAHI